jgi:thioredoxin 1
MEPVIEQFAANLDGKLRLAKIDVDESINLTMQFQVMSVPTLILFHQGEAIQRASGNQPRSRIEEKFAPYIENVKPGE